MKTTLLILLTTISIACAGSVRFTGVITSTLDTTLPVQVGDPFAAHVVYKNDTGEVLRTRINVGLLRFNYPGDGAAFTAHSNPCDLFVSYQVSNSPHLNLLLFGFTFNSCVTPTEFAVNEWTFFLNGQTSGVLTEIPEVHP